MCNCRLRKAISCSSTRRSCMALARTGPKTFERMANLLQIGSAFGRSIEAVNRSAMSVALYPVLAEARASGALTWREVQNAIARLRRGLRVSDKPGPRSACGRTHTDEPGRADGGGAGARSVCKRLGSGGCGNGSATNALTEVLLILCGCAVRRIDHSTYGPRKRWLHRPRLLEGRAHGDLGN